MDHTEETKNGNNGAPLSAVAREACEALRDKSKANVEHVRGVLMELTVALEKDERDRNDPDALEATSGIPKEIRRASEAVSEAWQCVNGAHGAIHDAFDALSLSEESSTNWCEGVEPDAARELFAALASLKLAEKYIVQIARQEWAAKRVAEKEGAS